MSKLDDILTLPYSSVREKLTLLDQVNLVAEAEAELIRLRQDRADLLEALNNLVKCPRVSGMSAQIRVDAKQEGRVDELSAARALIARLEKPE